MSFPTFVTFFAVRPRVYLRVATLKIFRIEVARRKVPAPPLPWPAGIKANFRLTPMGSMDTSPSRWNLLGEQPTVNLAVRQTGSIAPELGYTERNCFPYTPYANHQAAGTLEQKVGFQGFFSVYLNNRRTDTIK